MAERRASATNVSVELIAPPVTHGGAPSSHKFRDLESMELSFHGVKGGAAYATAVKVVRFRPVTPENDARELRARRVAFSARILGGAIWLGDGADLGMAGGAMASGVGGRVAKGMHRNFVFEAEIVAGGTSEIVFGNVTWDAMQGDIRLKNYWTVGVEISNVGVVQSLSKDTLRGGFEGGLRVGYGWGP